MSDTNKRVALITGSGRKRVGNVVARALGKQGYQVAIHYRSSRDEAERTVAEFAGAGIAAEAFQADVADESHVDRLFDQVLQRFGQLDVLVTTASIWDAKPLEDVTAEDVLENFRVNTLGTFLCCRRGGLQMVAQPAGGAIVTFGDWAIRRPYPDHAAYFTAKGAIPTLTRVMAVELARRNPKVRVNCIHPGPVMFPPNMSQAERQQTVEATLLKTADQPEAISQTVQFCIDNPLLTGACIAVDAGRSIFAP